jgi:hypothetical protein
MSFALKAALPPGINGGFPTSKSQHAPLPLVKKVGSRVEFGV